MRGEATRGPVTDLPGVGRGMAECFERLGIRTIGDLIAHYPARHEDRDTLGRLADAWAKTQRNPDHICTILGRCLERSSFMVKGREVLRFRFTDDHDEVDVPAWSPRHRFFKVGGYYLLTGKLKQFRGEWSLGLADYEVYDEDLAVGESLNLGRIVPIYPGTEGLSQKRIRQAVHAALEAVPAEDVDWALPVDLVRRRNFPDRLDAIRALHFPPEAKVLEQARNALVFEELYLFQQALATRKMAAKSGKEPGRYRTAPLEAVIRSSLPFALSEGQNQALTDILADMDSVSVMTRLLHGEVGSGKTVVALMAMVHAALSGHQAVLMAPTDLLARQHERVLRQILAPQGLAPALVVGGMAPGAREKVKLALRTGDQKIAVGTQALFSEDMAYVDLTLVVVDEQHRFGVEQRNLLTAKGRKPDLLLMSATPIPQTLSLSIFGDLDVSVLPKRAGAGARKTKVLPASERIHAYRFLMDRIRRGEQAYVVFPAIGDGGEGDSEKAAAQGVKALVKEAAFLKEKVFQAVPVGVLHGKIDEGDRDRLMEQFVAGEVKALLATTVIEVGIDVPRATVLVIENAERFGLSQLHQLRGRVGRGALPGFVYLVPGPEAGPEALTRLETFAGTEDGFAIAQLDLEMRGPGELLGAKQAGMLRFRLADLVRDFKLLTEARTEAQTRITHHAAEKNRRDPRTGLPPG